jgi:hypothetical protein
MTTQSNYAPLFIAEGDTTRRSRWVTGILAGAVMGLVYGLVANTIDLLVLWGVPLRVEAGEVFWAVVGMMVGTAIIGLITAWPESSFKGIIAGALVMTVAGVGNSYLNQSGANGQYVTATIVLITAFLPSAALSLFITVPLRLAVNQSEDALHQAGRVRAFRLARAWVALIVVVGLIGSFAQMSDVEKEAVQKVNRLVQTALTTDKLPDALADIANFRERAHGGYTLAQAAQTDVDFTIAGSTGVTSVLVDVLFDSGLHFQCLVGESLARPLCTE